MSICHHRGGDDGSPSCGDGMFAVVICLATPACGSGISRCRIQLLWILSVCATRAVSVNWCSGVFLGFVAGIECCMVLTGLMVPGSVCIGCPLGRFAL